MPPRELVRALSPKSIALVGGSLRARSLGALILRNIVEGGFDGDIAVVNTRYENIAGIRSYASISALPFVPDLIVITTPPSTITDIVVEAGNRGVVSAIIISSGLGHGPGSIADAVAHAARRFGIRIIGPNCLGVIVPHIGLDASFAAKPTSVGSLALISQSGAVAAAMVDWGAEKSIGFSGIVSLGDQLDVDVADLLDYFGADKKTSAIILYVEAITDAPKFMKAARSAALLKPVIVLKAGRSSSGAKAAATHTGAMAGSNAVYNAAFRQAGLVRVSDFRELLDCAELLGRYRDLPRAKNLAILTNGGGLGVLAVDRLNELGGVAAELDAVQIEKLNSVLPPTWSRSNPVDIGGDADGTRYAAATDILLADPSSDALLIMNVETAVESAETLATAVAKRVGLYRAQLGSSIPKPILAAWVGTERTVERIFDDARISNFSTEADAVMAFMQLTKCCAAQTELQVSRENKLPSFDRDVAKAREIMAAALQERRRWLDPVEIFRLLTAYSIPIVPVLAAIDPEDAAVKAKQFLDDGEVVVKIMSRAITHKSDIGGVKLNLKTEGEVEKAAREVMKRATLSRPDAQIDGIIVQPMISRPAARELILGVASDPTFGPVIAFGQGGTAVEVINDKAVALPPINMNFACELINQTAVSRLLRGYRNVPAVPPDAIPLTLIKLSQMIEDCPEIFELDINPLLADERGVLVLDARVAVCEANGVRSARIMS